MAKTAPETSTPSNGDATPLASHTDYISGLPALSGSEWDELKAWIRREIGYAQEGHSAEERATELNP